METEIKYTITLDHDKIRSWIEEHSAVPAIINRKENDGEGVLAIKFKESDAALETISWQEFFDKFESSSLALRYDGEIEKPGMFSYNFVHRNLIEALSENDSLDGGENNEEGMPEDDVPVENIFGSAPEDPKNPDYPGINTEEGSDTI